MHSTAHNPPAVVRPGVDHSEVLATAVAALQAIVLFRPGLPRSFAHSRLLCCVSSRETRFRRGGASIGAEAGDVDEHGDAVAPEGISPLLRPLTMDNKAKVGNFPHSDTFLWYLESIIRRKQVPKRKDQL